MPEVYLQLHKFEHQVVFLPCSGRLFKFFLYICIQTHTPALCPVRLLCDLATPRSGTLAAGGKGKSGQTHISFSI